MQDYHLVCLGIHGNPHPLFVRLLLHEACYFVCFRLKTLYHQALVTGDGLYVKMVRQRLKATHEKTQEPFEPDTHRATNAAQGNPLEQ